MFRKIFFSLFILFAFTSIVSVCGQKKITNYFLGTSYYPQWWDQSQWDNDFKKMSEIGFNVVRMGDLAWTSFESEEGKFNFAWLDKAIEKANKYGIAVILCTPTSAIPPWLLQKYPDVLSGNEKGKYDFGSRKGYNTNSENYLKACDRIVIAMSEHYANNKNVIGWQIDNEPGYPFVMYDDITKSTYQQWLKKKYITIDSLNNAWQGVFWSLKYNDWNQIPLPPLNKADGNACPGHLLDYRRFFSYSFQNYLKRQNSILRKYVGDRFIFTNWPNTHWSVDVFEAANFLDFCGWDSYMEYAGINDFRGQYEATVHHDLCRTTEANQFFIVSEEAAQANSWASPKGVRLKMLMDFAHGSKGTLLYEWIPPLGGAEQGFSSVLNPDGSNGPAYDETKKACKEIAELSTIMNDAKTESDVALLFCYDNQWNQGFWGSNTIRGYDENIILYYKGLKALKRNIDIISINSNIKNYKIIAAPGLQIVSDELAIKLKEFVANGGILILDKNCGTKDIYNRLREIPSKAVFADITGISVSFLDNKVYGDAKNFKINFGENKLFSTFSYIDQIELKTAKTVATINGGFLNDKPIITINSYLKGSVIYVGADSKDVAFYEEIANTIASRFNIQSIIHAPLSMEVISRISGNDEFIFLSNLEDKTQSISLPFAMYSVLDKKEVSKELKIEGLGFIVLKRKR